LKLEGNCIKTIRQTLIVKPTNELKTYLRTRGPSILQGDGTGVVGGTSGMGGGGGKASGGPGNHRNNQAVPVNNGLGDAVNYRIRDINGPTLSLNNLQLTDCPDAIVETMLSLPSGPNVTSIDLSTNMLTEIPRVFVELPQIKSLNLSGNKLKISRNMVSSGSPSTTLQSLDVSHNQFPSGSVVMEILFHQFPRLQELIMNHNTMTSLPMSLNRYPTLTSLKVSHCHLTDVTCLDFRQLHGLKVLDFGNNKLTVLPETLPYAANLEFLSIENNEFREIPTVLGILPALKTLLVAGNPQRLIRPNIIQSGSAKVIEWLKTKYVPTTDLTRGDHMIPPEPALAGSGGEQRRGRDFSVYDNTDAQIPPRPIPAGYQPSSGYGGGIREREDVSMTQGYRERNVPLNRGQSDYPSQDYSRDDHYGMREERYDERRGYVEEPRFVNGGGRVVGGMGRTDNRGRGEVSYDDDDAGYDSRVDVSRQVAPSHSYQPRSQYLQSRLQPEPIQPVSYGRQSSGAASGFDGYQESTRGGAASTNYSEYGGGGAQIDSTFEAPLPATSRSRAVVARGGGNASTIGDLLGGGGDAHSGSAMTSRGRVQRTETLKTLNSKRLGDYASGNR
jgi:hypothetical protein